MKHLVVFEADHAECWALGQPAYGESNLGLIEIASRKVNSEKYTDY